MKRIRLTLDIYARNIISSLFLFIIFTLSILFASLALGQYRYISYTKELFINSNLEDAVYYMPSGFGTETSNWSLERYRDEMEKVFHKIKSFAAVEELVKSAWSFNEIKLYDESLLNAFPLDMVAGEQLTSESNSNPDGIVDAVVGGYTYKDVKVGDHIDIPLYDNQNHSLKVHVVGKLSSVVYLPDFGVSSTSMDAQQLIYLQGNGHGSGTVICKNSPELYTYLSKFDVPTSYSNFFVRLKSNSTDVEKQELYDYLEQNGRYSDFDTIVKNTNETIAQQVKIELPLPLFFLFISTAAIISISILFVFKYMKRYSIYYLCGCSKLRGFTYIASAIAGISIIAGVINGSIIGCMDSMIGSGFLDLYQYRFDQMSIWSIVIYIAIVLVISIGIPYLVYRRMSPIALYRRIQS